MHFQILGSGSKGNAALVRAGDTHVLLDAGLSIRALEARLEAARVPLRKLDHVVLTHGHLDHARSAGAVARKVNARLHCCQGLMRNASVRRAPRITTLPVGRPLELTDVHGRGGVFLTAVAIPHDADPTVAFRLEHEGRVAVLATDLGRADPMSARALGGAHLIVLEFNHDREKLQSGPYTAALKRRIGGSRGHLSNAQAADMLRLLAGPELHTLVLAHLSETNNTPELARAAAHAALAMLGRLDVRVLVASQHSIGPNLVV